MTARPHSQDPAGPDPAPEPGPEGEPGAVDERRWIEAAQRDPAEFARLYRRHAPAIARSVRRRVGRGDLADDLVAETFLTALQQLPRFEARELGFRSWLYRLSLGVIARWARRRPSRWRSLDHEPEAPAEPPRDRAELARAALRDLPRRDQDVLSLHYLEGLPLNEVARILGCRPGTVKSRLSRARDALRRELRRRKWS